MYDIKYYCDSLNCNERYGEIYMVRNLKNNKIYIGQATRAPVRRHSEEKNIANGYTISRWRRHVYQARNIIRGRKDSVDYFHNALLKWGDIDCHFLDTFELSVIDFAMNKVQLNMLECQYISLFQTQDNTKGYNVRAGGLGGTMTEDTVRKRIENRRLEREVLSSQYGFPIIEGEKKLIQIGADPKLIRMCKWWDNAKKKGWLCSEWCEKLVGWSRFYHEVGHKIKSEYWLIEPVDRNKPISKDNVTWDEFNTNGELKSVYLSEQGTTNRKEIKNKKRSINYSGGGKEERRLDNLACSEFRYRWSTETQDWVLRPGKTALIIDD